MKDIKYEAYNLFPTLVLKTNLDRNFTEEETNTLNDACKECKEDPQYEPDLPGLSKSVLGDTYVLNRTGFKRLRSEILVNIKNYFNEVWKPRDNIDIVMTQSWINILNQGEYHPKHNHSNSIISGVLYIKTEKGAQIAFDKSLNTQIQIESTEYNLYNSPTWTLDMEDMDLLIFPSTLSHYVPVKKHDGTRISLSFNTWFKGTIGDYYHCTELKV